MRNLLKKRVSLKYLLISVLTIAAVFTPLYFWIAIKQRHLIMAQVEKQAIILHRQIVLTRQWVADHSYVLVSRQVSRPGGRGMETGDFSEIEGQAYTHITPAGLTRRLSEYASRNDLYAFNLTNFNALNPDNIPDAFEAEALEAFNAGRAEALSRVERHGDDRLFRYAAPLVIGESCLSCHRGPQYRLGAIGGCISVLIPFNEAHAAIRDENLNLFYSMAALTLGVILILYLATQFFIFGPIKDIRRITSRLRTDALDPGIKLEEGDELERVAGLCSVMDEKLQRHHQDLEKQIAAATRDLNRTNTQLASANQDLAQLNMAKTQFFSEISHELRTPLTSIKGAADILARRSDQATGSYVGIIQRNTELLIHSVSDFLDFAKIENRRLELECSLVDVPEVAAESIANLQPSLERKDLSVALEVDKTAPIKGDRHRIGQVLTNLLVNAAKFSPPGERIDVSVEQVDHTIRIRVVDRGPGIHPDHHEAVFRKFYQLRPMGVNTSVHRGSAGLGLAICRGIAAAHGGRIWVESEAGQGSCFCLDLPIEGREAACVAGADIAPSTLTNEQS